MYQQTACVFEYIQSTIENSVQFQAFAVWYEVKEMDTIKCPIKVAILGSIIHVFAISYMQNSHLKYIFIVMCLLFRYWYSNAGTFRCNTTNCWFVNKAMFSECLWYSHLLYAEVVCSKPFRLTRSEYHMIIIIIVIYDIWL